MLSFYDFTFSKRLPDYVYLYFVLSIFLGQTFDAIDGKHARNTNRGSPLGQLMDHGCDAITNSCYTIFIGQSYVFGDSYKSLIMLQLFVHVRINLYYLYIHLAYIFCRTMGRAYNRSSSNTCE